MSFSYLGRRVLGTFVGLLPWSVLIAVFFGDKLGLPLFRFWKEIFLIILFGIFCLSNKSKERTSWDSIDGTIVLYALWMIIVSLVNHTTLIAYVYGFRYDVEFLLAFLFLRRAIPIWGVSPASMARVFLVSGGVMLIVSILIRYIFGETILTLFGFNGVIGSADAGGAPPIYHDIDGSSVVRFQGVLEGPNQMAFFLIVYMATYATALMRFARYRVINTVVLILLLFLFLETYSRSAYIGIVVGAFVTMGASLVALLKSDKYLDILKSLLKKILLPGIILVVIFLGVLFQFRGQFYDIFNRHGSTSGHYERMMIGLTRFASHPLGSGLGQAGPASRGIDDVNDKSIEFDTIKSLPLKSLAEELKSKNPDFYFTKSNYYIPESWYVQQLVEGGIIGCLLLISILTIILFRLKKNVYFFGAFVAVMLMNIFLHSFESVHTTLAFFLLLAGLLPVQAKKIQLTQILKYTFSVFLFLLPWHALLITTIQCKFHIDPTFIRFWKEFFVGIFFLITSAVVLFRDGKSVFVGYRSKPVLLSVGLFLLWSCIYIIFPGFQLSPQSLLGFRYDVFFLLALCIGMCLPGIQEHARFFVKTLLYSTGLMLAIFLVWYMFFDISTTVQVFGFSDAVSTFHPETCLAFSQNVAGHHRLQGTFGGPIRFSVFVVMMYIIFVGSLLQRKGRNWITAGALLIGTGLVSLAVFYSYSKTSSIGLFMGIIVYAILYARFVASPSLRKYVLAGGILVLICLSAMAYQKHDLFEHAGSIMVRQENITKTWQMFLEKPFGYGLGTAGPASQIQGSGFQFSESNVDFLPENWYLQILIEQGIIGFIIFLMVIMIIGRALWQKMIIEKDPYSIALFSAFLAVVIMGCFTHVFEEAATSYALFFLIGLHLYKRY